MAPTSFAQRIGGGGGGAPPPRQAPSSPEEKQRAQTAAEWADMIEHARANLPQHPPEPTIKFPSKNAQFLGSLKYAENQKAELSRYLDKLWGASKDLESRRVAVDGLWTEATKPAWI